MNSDDKIVVTLGNAVYLFRYGEHISGYNCEVKLDGECKGCTSRGNFSILCHAIMKSSHNIYSDPDRGSNWGWERIS